MLYQVTFTIYGPDKADELIALDDKLVLMPVIHSEDEYNTYTGAGLNMALAQFNSSMYTGSVGSKFIDEAHSLGISFFANCYVNDTRTPKGTDFNQIDRFIRLNGQIIQTDYPVDVKEYVKTKGLN
jgi:glycerophosphoryl diester phosphodiesterase